MQLTDDDAKYLWFRKPLLYPPELQGHKMIVATRRVVCNSQVVGAGARQFLNPTNW